MQKTSIEWVKNPDGTQGYTWNPITGCLNGCEYCYARKLANGRLRSRYLANNNLAGGYRLARGVLNEGATPPNLNPFYPRFWPSRLEQPFEIKGSAGIFPCDMSDLFGIGIPHEWTEGVMNVIKIADRHRFYLLTKQPQNLPQFSPFPDNCWVGVTATDTRMALEACLKLGDIEASIRYLSIEPMLNSINLPSEFLKVCKIDQVILGAQTKPYKPPKIEWVKEIAEACDKAGVLVFLKDNIRPLVREGMWPSWSMDDRADLRQEMLRWINLLNIEKN